MDLLGGERLDHLLSEVVDGLHLGGLERELADLGAGAGGGPIDLDLDHLALDDLGLLLDAHADGAAKGLRERLGLAHLEREDLAARYAREGRVLAERLGHAHGDRGLAGARLAGDEERAARYLALLDHLEYEAGGASRLLLADHALRDLARVERVVEAEAADVRVSADALHARDLAHLFDFRCRWLHIANKNNNR